MTSFTPIKQALATKPLVNHFAPIVMEGLAPLIEDINRTRRHMTAGNSAPAAIVRAPIIAAEFQYQNENVCMFYLTIDFHDTMTITEHRSLVDHLEEWGFAGTDEALQLRFADLRWALGDGDDYNACMIHKGKFAIWLRGWK